jgi:hypothetical protein
MPAQEWASFPTPPPAGAPDPRYSAPAMPQPAASPDPRYASPAMPQPMGRPSARYSGRLVAEAPTVIAPQDPITPMLYGQVAQIQPPVEPAPARRRVPSWLLAIGAIAVCAGGVVMGRFAVIGMAHDQSAGSAPSTPPSTAPASSTPPASAAQPTQMASAAPVAAPASAPQIATGSAAPPSAAGSGSGESSVPPAPAPQPGTAAPLPAQPQPGNGAPAAIQPTTLEHPSIASVTAPIHGTISKLDATDGQQLKQGDALLEITFKQNGGAAAAKLVKEISELETEAQQDPASYQPFLTRKRRDLDRLQPVVRSVVKAGSAGAFQAQVRVGDVVNAGDVLGGLLDTKTWRATATTHDPVTAVWSCAIADATHSAACKIRSTQVSNGGTEVTLDVDASAVPWLDATQHPTLTFAH